MTNSPAANEPIPLRKLSAPEGWFAGVLEASYPVEPALLNCYRRACAVVLDKIPAFSSPLQQEVLLQFDRFDPGRDVPLLQRNAREWMPEIGLGIWPHRGSPTLWTKDEFEETPIEKLRPLMHKVFRIQPDRLAAASAWQDYLGSGTLLRIAVNDSSQFYQKTMDYLQSNIIEPALKSFPLYAPLLEGAALKGVDGKQIAQWLCGADAYVRESREDNGLFFLCQQASNS